MVATTSQPYCRDQEPRGPRGDQNPRQWYRYSTRSEGKDLQPVLHDQACGRRHRAWPLHQSRHHRQATRRLDRGRTQPGEFTELRIVCRARLCSNPPRLEIRHRLVAGRRVTLIVDRRFRFARRYRPEPRLILGRWPMIAPRCQSMAPRCRSMVPLATTYREQAMGCGFGFLAFGPAHR